MSKEQNIEKEKNFPKNPDDISGQELKEHFDLNNDGKVNIEEYAEHINYHCENPETLQDELEQAEYQRGFKYKKGGLIFLVKESEIKPKYYDWEDYNDDRDEHWIDKDNNGYQVFTINRLLSDNEIKKIKNILKRNNTIGYVQIEQSYNKSTKKYEDDNEHTFTITSETSKIKDKVIDEIKKEFPKDKLTEAFAKGGKTKEAKTWKEKYNKKYGNDLDESNSLAENAKDTGVSKKGLQKIYNKGVGAYKTNPGSVRPNVKSKEQWAQARVYSAVMGGKASKVDAKELKMEKGGEVEEYVVIKGNKTKTFDNKKSAKEYKKKNGGEYAEIIDGRLKVYKDQYIYEEGGETEDKRREIIDKHRYAKSVGDSEMADEALEEYRMFCAVKGFKKGGLAPEKAKKILEDGMAQGKKLTDKQKRYFGYIAGGGKGKYAEGGIIVKYEDVVKIKRPRRNKKDWGSLEGQKKIPQIVYYTKGKNKEDIYSAELVEEIKGKGYRVMRDQDYAKGGKLKELIDPTTGKVMYAKSSEVKIDNQPINYALHSAKLKGQKEKKEEDIKMLEMELEKIENEIQLAILRKEKDWKKMERTKLAIRRLITRKSKELHKIITDLK